jgi:hypothetical protein
VSHVEHYYDYVDFRTEIADLTVFEASYNIFVISLLLVVFGDYFAYLFVWGFFL